MKTIGVITSNLDFFNEQKAFFLKGIPIKYDNLRSAHAIDGTRVLLIRPNLIEIDSCSTVFDILVFEFPTHLPRMIE